jgi:late competence protein required for DNA uptake (superfamily II DNA/RNA helicase)
MADYNYSSKPDINLKCARCLKVAEDPYQHDQCGQLFCRECLEKHQTCVNCRRPYPVYYMDSRSMYEQVEGRCPSQGISK